MQTKTDAQLLREYVTGSETAFGELVSRHADLVYSAALRQVIDPDFARDVAQSVFADLARKAKSLSGNIILAGWLYRSTRFAALTFRRNERRRQNRERQAMQLLEPPGESSPDSDRIRPVLDEAMANLGDADRDALVLRFFKNEDLRSVGIALGTSEDAAQKRVSRALEKLRALLLRRGVTLSAAALASALTGSAVQAAPAALAGAISSAVVAGATAAVAGSTFNLLNLMSMTKLKAGLLSAVVVFGAGTSILVQHQSVARLRAENNGLLEQSQQWERLRSENQQLAGLRAEAEEVERLRKEVAELHRLRAEVARLRRESAERRGPPSSPQAQGPGVQSTRGKLSDYSTIDMWSDAGTSTPEASVETLLWALRTGDKDRLEKMIQWQVTGSLGAPDVDLAPFEKEAVDSMRRAVEQMEGGRISMTEPLSENGVKLQFQATLKDGQSVSNVLFFARQNTGWKVAVSVLREKDPQGGSRVRTIFPFIPEQVTSEP